MDEAVGRVLDALDERGIADKTLIVFLSDNGGSQNTYSCNGPLHGHKYTLAEGGIRVPMLMRWPGHIPAAKTVNAMVLSLDVLPTCLDAADGAAPEVDGKSVLPLLREREAEVHEALFWDQGTSQRPDWAVRAGSWKLRKAPGYGTTRTYCGDNSYGRLTTVRNGLVFYDYPTPSGMLLYNLDEDPGEQRNLAEERPAKVAQLTALYAEWQKQIRDSHLPVEE